MSQITQFVGLDVGKFEILCFNGATSESFAVPNTQLGHSRLVDQLGPPESLVVALEPTGGYEWPIWQTLTSKGYDARQISAAHVRAFARAKGVLAKTDQYSWD